MDSFIDSVLIALIQGLTEFLPISSSGHLIILRAFSLIGPHLLVIDVAAHFGTLCASLVYFRSELRSAFIGAPSAPSAANRRLLWILLVGSLPVFIVGVVLFFSGAIFAIRHIEIVAWANLVFASLLWLSDRARQTEADWTHISFGAISLIGIAQIAALIPGASRAGTVISMARALGLSRSAAARLAMFLAIPAILGATALAAIELESLADLGLAVFVAFLSFVIGLSMLSGFIRFSQHFSLTIFVIYRLALSALLFVLYW